MQSHYQPPDSDVVHDQIRLCQHPIRAISCIGVRIGSRHMQHTGTTECGETVIGPSSSSELSTGGGASEMISDSCSDTNRQGSSASARTCFRWHNDQMPCFDAGPVRSP
jgi:hypothetical protein